MSITHLDNYMTDYEIFTFIKCKLCSKFVEGFFKSYNTLTLLPN
jgi:hypothetical protein